MTKIIGLTGGIGSGKTTVSKYIASKGIPVYIADDEAKKIMNKPSVIAEIKAIFTTDICTKDGRINRKKIASIVFNNKDKLNELNAIVHPKVRQHFKDWLTQHATEDFVVKEVAILFETKMDKECYKTILVTAPLEERIKRTMKRDNTTRENVLARMKNQLSEEEKIKRSDFIIVNNNLTETYKKTDSILKKFKIINKKS